MVEDENKSKKSNTRFRKVKNRIEQNINIEPKGVGRLLSIAYGNKVTPRDKILLETLEGRLREIGGTVKLDLDKIILYYITDISLNEILPFKVRDDLEIECKEDKEIVYSIPEVILSDDWLMFYDRRKTKEDYEYGPDRLQKIPKGAEIMPYKEISKTDLELDEIYEYIEGYMVGPLSKQELNKDTKIVKLDLR